MDELKLAGDDTVDAGAGDGFLRIAAATPQIRVGDVKSNAEAILACVRRAADEGVRVLVLPELCLTGYTCADLFHDRALLRACENALAWLLDKTSTVPVFFTVGMPYSNDAGVYNCAACCCAGQLLGMSVKSHLPNYREFYEGRWFSPAPSGPCYTTRPIAHRSVPFGAGLVYRCIDEAARTWSSASRSARTCGSPTALHGDGARGRGDRDLEPQRLRRGDRQVRLPPGPRARPVCAPVLRLRVRQCGGGRVHHGPRLRRREPHRGERDPCSHAPSCSRAI